MREIRKKSFIIKNVTEVEDTMMQSAERPSNYFSKTFIHNQAEQIKKEKFLSKFC